MSEKNDGGPAFPSYREWEDERKGHMECEDHRGMSLRDYFAGQALKGMLSGMVHINEKEYVIPNHRHAVPISYEFADAMLKEREK